MSARLRPARLGDIEVLLAIKHELALRRDTATAGGFLLGSTAAEYAALIEHGIVEVLEHDGRVVGFATAVCDATLRASALWQRRALVRWCGFDPEAVLAEPLGYFDQLAVRPGVRARGGAAALALRAVLRLLDDGHRHLFATTVVHPVNNRAAWGLFARIGWEVVGELDEVHPAIGSLRSAVHYVAADRVRGALAEAARAGGPAVQQTLALARL